MVEHVHSMLPLEKYPAGNYYEVTPDQLNNINHVSHSCVLWHINERINFFKFTGVQ